MNLPLYLFGIGATICGSRKTRLSDIGILETVMSTKSGCMEEVGLDLKPLKKMFQSVSA